MYLYLLLIYILTFGLIKADNELYLIHDYYLAFIENNMIILNNYNNITTIKYEYITNYKQTDIKFNYLFQEFYNNYQHITTTMTSNNIYFETNYEIYNNKDLEVSFIIKGLYLNNNIIISLLFNKDINYEKNILQIDNYKIKFSDNIKIDIFKNKVYISTENNFEFKFTIKYKIEELKE